MSYGSNPRLAARMQADQAAAQDRNSRAASAAAKQAAGPNFRANVTPGMSPDQARFEQAKAYQNYSAQQKGEQNYAADVSHGMKTDEARSTQANAYRNAMGGQQAQAQQQPAKPNPDAGPFSAYAAPGGGGFSSYAQPSKASATQSLSQFQQFGQQNDLSKPQGFNLWGAQAASQAGMKGQSYTMPGYSQSFDTLTGQQRGQPQQSFAGNLAHQAPANRPGPINWSTQGMDGQTYNGQQGFQQAVQQRDAFMGGQGGLINRLGQYASGEQQGAPTFDFQGMLDSANRSISNTGWQNPFTSPQAQTPTPSLNQPFYDPRQPASYPMQGGSVQGFPAGGDPRAFEQEMARQGQRPWGDAMPIPADAGVDWRRSDGSRAPRRRDKWYPPADAGVDWRRYDGPQDPGDAAPLPEPVSGGPYRPSEAGDSLPPVPPVSRAAEDSPDYRPQTPKAAPQPQVSGTRGGPAAPSEASSQAVSRIDAEINAWKRSTQGSGTPQAWRDHIKNLNKLRQRAMSGDEAALAWRPKMKAPPPVW